LGGEVPPHPFGPGNLPADTESALHMLFHKLQLHKAFRNIGENYLRMKISIHNLRTCRHRQGFTVVEQVMSIALGLIMIGGIVSGFIQTTRQAEWSAYSLAAQSMANQCLEQSRAAKWDLQAYPQVDELVSTNFPTQVLILDIPATQRNIVYATNIISITDILTNQPSLKMVRVDCIWPFPNRGLFTNSVFSYRAPDQ
jgi:hypothetical protein